MNLKLQSHLIGIETEDAARVLLYGGDFNRTLSELKLGGVPISVAKLDSFNLTLSELKHNQANDYQVCVKGFNRTLSELKRDF